MHLIAALGEAVVSRLDAVVVFDEIDSTNAEASRRNAGEGIATRLIVAAAQSAGRGRRGRQWLSPPGAGVYMSLSRPLSGRGRAVQALSLVTAISVHTALAELGGKGLQLKWPNDVLAGNRKLAGILLESESVASGQGLIFGIGINLALSASQRQAIGRPVTDLATVLGEDRVPEEVVAAVTRNLLRDLSRFEAEGFLVFQERWNAHDRYRDKDVVIASGKNRTIGRSRGVDDQGALLLRSTRGLERISAGEIFPSLHEV